MKILIYIFFLTFFLFPSSSVADCKPVECYQQALRSLQLAEDKIKASKEEINLNLQVLQSEINSLKTKIKEEKTRTTNLTNQVNNLSMDLESGTKKVGISKKIANTKNSCSWHAIKTHEFYECPGRKYVTAVCLTNRSDGCPDGTSAGQASAWQTTGAVKCCNVD